MNSTPRCARVTAPGLPNPEPPPTKAGTVAVWCGASNGGTSLMPNERRVPLNERIDATSNCSSSVNGAMMPGKREASIVLPVPGGPIISTWWPPAAAVCNALLAPS